MLDNSAVRNLLARAVEPPARVLLRLHVTPNQVTVAAALITSGISMATWGRGEFGWGLLAGFPFIIGDMLDGTMARLSGRISKFGGFLDSVMDRVTDAAILGSLVYWFAASQRLDMVIVCLVSLGSAAVVPYARAKAEALGTTGKVGLMERSDRLLVLSLGALAAALGYPMALEVALYLLAVLTSFTVLQRVHAVKAGLAHEAS